MRLDQLFGYIAGDLKCLLNGAPLSDQALNVIASDKIDTLGEAFDVYLYDVFQRASFGAETGNSIGNNPMELTPRVGPQALRALDGRRRPVQLEWRRVPGTDNREEFRQSSCRQPVIQAPIRPDTEDLERTACRDRWRDRS